VIDGSWLITEPKQKNISVIRHLIGQRWQNTLSL